MGSTKLLRNWTSPNGDSSFLSRIRNMPYYGKLIQTLEGFTMKKFLLVTMIGVVLAMDLYGIVKQNTIEEVKEINHIKETTIAVYVE